MRKATELRSSQLLPFRSALVLSLLPRVRETLPQRDRRADELQCRGHVAKPGSRLAPPRAPGQKEPGDRRQDQQQRCALASRARQLRRGRAQLFPFRLKRQAIQAALQHQRLLLQVEPGYFVPSKHALSFLISASVAANGTQFFR